MGRGRPAVATDLRLVVNGGQVCLVHRSPVSLSLSLSLSYLVQSRAPSALHTRSSSVRNRTDATTEAHNVDTLVAHDAAMRAALHLLQRGDDDDLTDGSFSMVSIVLGQRSRRIPSDVARPLARSLVLHSHTVLYCTCSIGVQTNNAIGEVQRIGERDGCKGREGGTAGSESCGLFRRRARTKSLTDDKHDIARVNASSHRVAAGFSGCAAFHQNQHMDDERYIRC